MVSRGMVEAVLTVFDFYFGADMEVIQSLMSVTHSLVVTGLIVYLFILLF